ncbi:hypothetical protein WCD74_06245 [Actinomycetospora sp. OC33-EN08]|uniref:Uncharacterized protein n=1 Tax=Actinomycetospora aurantiaca TaxID=3129233 RepID=A0ABU8MK84_9PSEU
MSRAGRGRTGGAGPSGGRRGGRTRAGDLRERADEMAALLDEAAPRARRRRRRSSTALPAAVAAFGALSVGGVGLALGLTPTGTEGLLPAAPSPALADPVTELPTTSAEGVATTTADLDPAVAGADLIRPDDGRLERAPARPAPTTAERPSSTSSAAPTTTTRSRPTTTRSTTPRPSKPPRPTVTRSATPRSSATPTSSASTRPIAERSALPGTTAPEDDEPTTTASTTAPDTPDTADDTDE